MKTADNCVKCAGNRKPQDEPACGCKDGYYNEDNKATCPKCHDNCFTCKDKADNCITCSGDRINPPKCVPPPPVAKSVKVEDVPVGSA